jgi:hypothetical protein
MSLDRGYRRSLGEVKIDACILLTCKAHRTVVG